MLTPNNFVDGLSYMGTQLLFIPSAPVFAGDK